ncbi:hypothetical protein KP509_11G086800 [Ceratopteris richardii]|uniref:RRM domain-containing protein n=1 Tax=Ceratopteris richardii TaxID=49495 RepID=A0A8T2TTJ1_CERRI|nr:hypothetical protein KP509_11G086800 [Ceratopteris richardii]KAH7426142.1 hypothetical protein KP509_11G086800 [Ceratopteris richardii]
MDTDQGKLFIGGISWETTEGKLKEYFQAFGEVIEAVIMKDRATGRARGFGFIVFADPSVADSVVHDKHRIDGRLVEAKKAVPREEQQIVNRNNNTNGGVLSPSSVARTKKIFVGGLASSVTENDFRKYFEQFGTITDVVVMYDHNTQRPRGFGFITFDSEDAVDKVLVKIFHELNGKMVEVKRAIPKDLSPSPNRLIGAGLGTSPHRVSPFYGQGFNSSSGPSYGLRMDSRYMSPLGNRNSYSPAYGALSYASNANFGGVTNGVYGAGSFGGSALYNGGGYGSGSSAGTYGRMGAGFTNPTSGIPYASPSGRNVWNSGTTSYGNMNSLTGFGVSNGAASQSNYSAVESWTSAQSSQPIGTINSLNENPQYGFGSSENAFLNSISLSHAGQTSVYGNVEGAFGASRSGSGLARNPLFDDLYGRPGYDDSTWRATPADTLKVVRAGSGRLGSIYGLDTANDDVEELSNKSRAYSVSGPQPYKGVAV